MIEKMKKVTFLVTANEYEQFLIDLREVGVVHVQQLQQGATSDQLQGGMALVRRYEGALSRLEAVGKTYTPNGQAVNLDKNLSPLQLLQHIEALEEEKNRLMHAADACLAKIEQIEPWGEFPLEAIERIERECSLRVNFFSCPTKLFKREWVDEFFATPIDEVNKRVYFITFSAERPDITAEFIDRPQEPLSHYKTELEKHQKRMVEIEQELLAIWNEQQETLREGLREAQNDVRLSEVKLSGEDIADGVVRLMVGWTLEERLQQLEEMLQRNHIFYEVEKPAFDDDVPIKITNGSFSRLFEPILRMYSLPNYNDIDPTEYMAPFFLVFFGLCMGDAGYGILIFLTGLWLIFKGKGDILAYGKLAAWLGGSTIVCGLLTGTFFGLSLSEQPWPWLEPVKPYFLNDEGVGPIFGYTPMMVISVIIGLIQVLLGMVMKAVKAGLNYGWAYSVGTFAWVVAILAAVVLFGLPFCGVTLPVVVEYALLGLIGLSAVGIYLYNNPEAYKKNVVLGPLMNIGGGLWSTYGMSTGLLGDLLSYIRLFALGLTGGVLGGVFNSLATQMTSEIGSVVLRILAFVIILLLGHGITFALSMISAFVHPMRLTFVEFFKNADFSGGGKAYNPFKKQ